MAGYMYLGSQRVCPVIVSGSSPEPVNYDSLLKVPDGIKTLATSRYFVAMTNYSETTPYPQPQKFLVDLNEVEEIGSFSFSSVFYFNDESQCSIKADNLKRITGPGAFNLFVSERPSDSSTPTFYEPEIHFPKLETITASCFVEFIKSGVTDVYFEKINSLNKYSFLNMLYDADSGIKLHFPQNASSMIQGLSGYPDFGGRNVTILYDQPATE